MREPLATVGWAEATERVLSEVRQSGVTAASLRRHRDARLLKWFGSPLSPPLVSFTN